MSERPGKPNPWDWQRYMGEGGGKPPMGGKTPGGPPFWAAALLIALGVSLFLGNLGLLPVHDIWVFWPIFPIAAGVGRMRYARNPNARFWGVALIVFGASFLFSNLGIFRLHIDNDRIALPVLMIVFGFVALMKVVGHSQQRRPRSFETPFMPPQPPWPSQPAAPIDFENSLHDFVLLGALKRKTESTSFAGGELTSILGSIEIDLRRACISSLTRSAVVNVTAVFGSIKLRVPQDWRVHVNATSILGNFEDKTIPPNIGPAASVLVITGLSLFSSVEIED